MLAKPFICLLKSRHLQACSVGDPLRLLSAAAGKGPVDAQLQGHLQEKEILGRELPEVATAPDDTAGGQATSEEELSRRKSHAVRTFMEEQLGSEQMELARILQTHHVLVRGGQEEGQRLLASLMDWKDRAVSEAVDRQAEGFQTLLRATQMTIKPDSASTS